MFGTDLTLWWKAHYNKSHESNIMDGFNSLELYHRSNILKQQAIYLLTMEIGDCSVDLYAWERFFIEQHFDGQRQVTKINFVGGSDLWRYLEKIDLDDLGYTNAK